MFYYFQLYGYKWNAYIYICIYTLFLYVLHTITTSITCDVAIILALV